VATLAEAAAEIGDAQVRNMGTIVGNISHADPASDLPAAILATDSIIHVQGPEGKREIEADDFFFGMYTTALDEDEIVVDIEVPKFDENEFGTYIKKASPSSGYAIVGVAVVLQKNGETIESARVAINGVLDHAIRLEAVEDALTGQAMTEELIEDAASRASDNLDDLVVLDDIQASDEFRLRLLEAYTERALEEVIGRAKSE
jgi:carbon-monoxide dehydrogenase medium subunit